MRRPPNQISATLEMLMVSVVTGSISACQRPAASAASDTARVGLREALPLEGLPGERPDHPDAGQLLAQHPVDAVDQPLHAAEDRQHPRHDQVVGHRQHRHADQQQPGQPGVLVDRHDDAADAHDRRGHQDGGGHLDQHLDLLDVVGGAGQQRRRAEPGGLALGERRSTWWNIAERRSRPKPIPVRDPKYTAPTAHTPCRAVTASITRPSRAIRPVSPLARRRRR